MSTETPDIIRTVFDGNNGILREMLSDNPDLVFTKDADSRTPLHWAASFQNLDMVKLLLNPLQLSDGEKSGNFVVDVDEFLDDSKWTPLHIAASAGNLEIFRTIATHEPLPDINLKTSTGQTCLHYAVSKNHPYLVEYMLRDLKASSRIKDNKGQLPIHRAAAIGSPQMITLLLEVGKSPIDTTDNYGMTALHYALAEGHGDLALQLVKLGADWRKETGDHETSFQVALNDNVRSFFKKGLIEEGLVEEEY